MRAFGFLPTSEILLLTISALYVILDIYFTCCSLSSQCSYHIFENITIPWNIFRSKHWHFSGFSRLLRLRVHSHQATSSLVSTSALRNTSVMITITKLPQAEWSTRGTSQRLWRGAGRWRDCKTFKTLLRHRHRVHLEQRRGRQVKIFQLFDWEIFDGNVKILATQPSTSSWAELTSLRRCWVDRAECQAGDCLQPPSRTTRSPGPSGRGLSRSSAGGVE